jgi:hypothetical protein
VLVTYQFVSKPKHTTKLTRFQLREVPAGSTVVVRCLTKSDDPCRGKLAKEFTKENASGILRVRRFERRIKAGNRLEAQIANPGYLTQYKTLTFRKNKLPMVTTECSQPGSTDRTGC